MNTESTQTPESLGSPHGSLLPCPFCNSAPARDGVHNGPRVLFDRSTLDSLVVCPFCEAQGPTGESPDQAICLWNDRPKHEANDQNQGPRTQDL